MRHDPGIINHKRATIKAFLLIVILCGVLNAGDPDRVSPSENFMSQGFILDSYHSIGFSNLNHAFVAEIISSNPASITRLKDLQLGMNYEYATKIDHLVFSDIGQSRSRQWLPNAFGSHVSLNNFHFGLGYGRKYSSSLDFGPIPITTVDDMSGESGETFTPDFEKSLYSFGGIVAYYLPNIALVNDALSVGLQLNINYFRAFETVPNFEVTKKGHDFNWKIGLNYAANDLMHIGFVYESGIHISGSYPVEGLIFNSDSSAQYDFNRQFSNKFEARLPQKIAFGFGLWPHSSVQFSTALSKILWQDIYDHLNDNYEFSMHTIMRLHRNFSATAGIYHNWLSIKKSSQQDYVNGKDYTYLNLGFFYQFRNLSLSAELYDSHWQSSKDMQRTIFKFGIGYRFARE